MEKIELLVADIHAASHPSEAFSLILKKKDGVAYVPIIIGMSEARAILVELNHSPTHRPLTHELFVSLANNFNCRLKEVNITHYESGVYYAQMLMQNQDEDTFDIDARPSDAIAIALKYQVPIFMSTSIFEENSVTPHEEEDNEFSPQEYCELSDFLSEDEKNATDDYINDKLKEMMIEELQALLDGAIENEDYELADKIQQEINRR